ncbi:hypothetical protein PHISCL_10871, partial [Aspergillus sclerotialis]
GASCPGAGEMCQLPATTFLSAVRTSQLRVTTGPVEEEKCLSLAGLDLLGEVTSSDPAKSLPGPGLLPLALAGCWA